MLGNHARPAHRALTRGARGVYMQAFMTRRLRRAMGFAAFATLLPYTGALGASDPNHGWIEVRSPHFVVSSNAGEKEARRIADQFEQFHALHYQYAHALLHLNFTGLPLWIDEGVAESYGNSRLGEKESKVGTIDQI